MSANQFTSRHGLLFMISAGGFGRDETAQQDAMERVEVALDRLSLDSALVMWAAAKHAGSGVADRKGEAHDRLEAICARAVRQATKHWADNSDCSVYVAALDPK